MAVLLPLIFLKKLDTRGKNELKHVAVKLKHVSERLKGIDKRACKSARK
jgi:hypothetical protein